LRKLAFEALARTTGQLFKKFLTVRFHTQRIFLANRFSGPHNAENCEPKRDQGSSLIVISKGGRGGRRYCPSAFTEHGALMVATVLNSPQAVKMSLFIIRAFIKMREEPAANAAILKRLAEIDNTLLTHDLALCDIYHKLRPLLEPPPAPPKPEIGFHIKEDEAPYHVAVQAGKAKAPCN
jgi:hypothetical protein